MNIMDDELKEKTKELLHLVKSYNKNADLKFIEKAIRFAHDAHKGQKRASGEDYFTHVYNVGLMLAELKLDYRTIAAGLLHDVVEDTEIKPDIIAKEFDKETLDLILSVTKLQKINEDNIVITDDQTRRAESIRKVILATAKDVRVIIIKIVDRLHNMRTLKHLPADKQRRISKETLEIYAPIAHKLGMSLIKAELEDLSLRFLEPEVYQEFKRKIASKKEQREREVKQIIVEIKAELKKSNIEAEVYGRAKHFYSIYKKIKKDKKQFSEIYDLTAIRILTSNIQDCYSALGIVHKIWKPIPRRFKDYVAIPKSNGYQSLHTTVVGSHGKILEVQIRTYDMHNAAEEGIASHWRYKGDEQDQKFDRKMEWLKQILAWKMQSVDANEFIESLKVDLFEKEIFVFTPKGDPIALPEEATPIDFAYAVHTDVGNHCKQAKVNGVIVPLDFVLSPGDIVEIVTSKSSMPSRSWLNFAKSANTKMKIKRTLGMEMDPPGRNKDAEKKKELAQKGLEFKDGHILYDGKKPNLKIPKCCNPKVGDNIRAFKTKDGKLAIHKSNCINLHAYDPATEVQPKVSEPKKHVHKFVISVKDRIGLLAEILSLIAKERQSVRKINTKFGKTDNAVITIEVMDMPGLDTDDLSAKIHKIKNVVNVYKEE